MIFLQIKPRISLEEYPTVRKSLDHHNPVRQLARIKNDWANMLTCHKLSRIGLLSELDRKANWHTRGRLSNRRECLGSEGRHGWTKWTHFDSARPPHPLQYPQPVLMVFLAARCDFFKIKNYDIMYFESI